MFFKSEDYAQAAWERIEFHYGCLADRYDDKLAADGKRIDDVAFLGFELVGVPSYHLSQLEVDDHRRMLSDVTLRINTHNPHFIASNAKWQDYIIAARGGNAHYHPTRKEVEGGADVGCLMLGGNVLLYAKAKRETVLFVHQRDNAADNPHPLCYSPAGGNVTERPSKTPPKELREELRLLSDVGGAYELPLLVMPERYGVLSPTELYLEGEWLCNDTDRIRRMAAAAHGDAFNAGYNIKMTSERLVAMPQFKPIEGTITVIDQDDTIIDVARGIIVYSPLGNKIGFSVPALLPKEFVRASRTLLAVDGENLPFLEEQGGRPVKALTIAEMDEACRRGPGEPHRALDLLKATHMRIRKAGVRVDRQRASCRP